MPGGEGGDLDYKLWGPWELPALMADTVTGRRSFFLSSSTLGSAVGTCLALPYGGTRPRVAGGCSRDGQGSAGTKLEHGLCLLLTVSLWARYLTSLSFRCPLGRVGKMTPASQCCREISSGKCLVHKAAPSGPFLPVPPDAWPRTLPQELSSQVISISYCLCLGCFASGLYLVEAQ